MLLSDTDATGAQAVEALPIIIDQLQANGFSIVSLSELVASDSDLKDAVNLSKVTMPKDAVLPTLSTEE